MLYSYIRSKQPTNNIISSLISDSVDDLSSTAEIAYSLNTYFQSVFVRKKCLWKSLHFASRTCTNCNDLKSYIYIGSSYREIDNLKDNKAIWVDKAIILKLCKAAFSRQLLIIFQKSFSLKICSLSVEVSERNS